MDVSFFVQMAWKSALIAGAALALAYVLRSRAASDRALVLRIGAAMLLALPLIALALPALPIEAWAAPEAASPAAAAAAPTAPVADLAYVPGPSLPLADVPAATASEAAAPTIWDDPTPLVLFIYLGGLLMVAGRLLAGLFMLRRWTRDARAVTCPEWLAAFDRARGDEKVRLMVSDALPSPLSWGWRRPVILIDPDTLDEPEEADAILAHELAHVARRDWPALIATRIAAAVFWFNPLVWLLEREIVQQAEEAADCEAAAFVEPARYAQTLLSWAQVTGRAIPANSIAPKQSALGRRIRAILDRRERPQGSAWTKIAAILCVVIAAPVAAVQLVQAAQAPAAPRAPHAPAAPRAIPSPPALPGVPAPPAPPPALPDVSAEVNEVLADVLPQIPQIVSSALASVDPDEIGREVEEALREAGPELDRLSREDRVRVGQEVRRALAQARVQVREAMRVQQVSQVQVAQAVREAQRAAQAVRPAIAASMRAGAGGMEHGAAGMEQGAQRMEQQAARFRDRNYRETVIARERARGRTVTHEDLLEAAEGMTEGAQGMREGAREMRAAAERMRDGRHD
jgi:beta-lactamase regulating signal transducer with metallopeptidase domain